MKSTKKPIYLLIIILFAAFAGITDAKTRHNHDHRDNTRNLSSTEIEERFRPYLEEKIRHRRGGTRTQRGVHAANRPVRPTQQDLFMLMRMWDDLTPEFRELYKRATDILPTDYDTFHISPSGKFKIYYSTSGENKINLIDTMGYGANGNPSSWRVRNSGLNNVPDYIDETAFALDSTWSMLVDRFGFVEPINAPDADGETAHYSVLISYLGYYGVTWPYERRTAGTSGFSSYIEINSDWSDWDDLGYDVRPYDAVRVTCAHELFHAVQYAMAYTVSFWSLDNLLDGWLEGSATLMEDIAFPEVKDYFQYIRTFFTNPSQMSFLGNSNIYTNSILLKYIYEKTNPNDSIGLIKAVHENSYAQRTLPFHRNIEQASQKYAQKSWAEVLNGFHTESYFTGNRARRQDGLFVSDAELMSTWRAPTANSANSETKSVRPNSVDFFLYTPQSDHSDTLVLILNGSRDASIDGQTWAASALVFENGNDIRIEPIQMNQQGSGRLVLANWKEIQYCLLVTTNASQSSNRNITVRIGEYTDPDPIDAPLSIYPNVVKLGRSRTMPVNIKSDGNITEIRIFTVSGKSLGYYNDWSGSRSPAFQKNGDGHIVWFPSRYLTPGVYIIYATSNNPATNKRNTKKSKIMITP